MAKYLRAYTTALKHQPFQKVFIDAFAGTGYRAERNPVGTDATDLGLFPDLAEAASQGLRDGSARIALQTVPPFDHYIFIEQRAERCAQLEELRPQFPAVAQQIKVLRGEANQELQRLCATDWRARRAVLFLDPYGMQVEWTTIAAVARTHAIDMWLLFPLGMGVNRLLKKSGDIPDAWRRRLNLLLGTEDWFRELYEVSKTPTLFDDDERVVKATTGGIGRYFNERLKTVFAGVADQPAVLRNSVNNPLYILCFAVGNPAAKAIALRIADHLLKGVR